jgi:hypothetical protein
MLLPLVLMLSLLTTQPGTPQTIARDTMSQVDAPLQAVAQSAAEWAALWRKHAGNTPPPAIDFGSRTVVAVFVGSRPSAGFTVEITGTREAGATLIVEYQERAPARGDITAQVLTSPAHIVSIQKFAGPIKFEKVQR